MSKHVSCLTTFFENEMKHVVHLDMSQMTILHVACTRHAGQRRQQTYTDTEYVILIVSPWQQWFRQRPLMSCYTYIVCLVTCFCYCLTYNTGCPVLADVFVFVIPCSGDINSAVLWILAHSLVLSFVLFIDVLTRLY